MYLYLYYMLYSIILLIILLKARKLYLFRRKLRELENKRGGLIISNKIITINAIFHKRNFNNFNKYIFLIWGYAELELKDDDKIEVCLVEIKPLDVNFTQIFAEYLKTGKEITKRHDSKEHFHNYKKMVEDNKFY